MFLSKKNKALISLCDLDLQDARDVFRRYSCSITKAKSSLLQVLLDDGCVDVTDRVVAGQILLDGVPVFWFARRAYALRPEVHAERLTTALEAQRLTQEPEAKSVAGTEGMSAMVCPKCGDALQHTKVCPSCAAGKIGYSHRYACACGAVDMVSKEAL